jgi:hypothetical protein
MELPQLAGEIQLPAGEYIAGVGVRAQQITIVTMSGQILQYLCTFASDGTSGVSLGSATTMTSPANTTVDLANVFGTSDLVYVNRGVASYSLLWHVLNADYFQASDSTSAPFLGSPYYFMQWYARNGYWARLLVTMVSAGTRAMRLYYFPGHEGNRSWQSLTYVSPSGATQGYYSFPPGGLSLDIWSGKSESSYVAGDPLWVIVTDYGTIRRLRIDVNLSNMTYSVKLMWTRNRAAARVVWFRAAGADRHIEITQDGTVRSVRPGLFR